jgi:hypothetical protein
MAGSHQEDLSELINASPELGQEIGKRIQQMMGRSSRYAVTVKLVFVVFKVNKRLLMLC